MSTRQSILWPLIGHELKLQLSQPSFAIFFVLAALLGSFIMQNQPISVGVEVWGPYYIASSIVKLGFGLPCLIAFFTIKASMRDFQHNMVELTFCTSITKSHFLATRWLGLFSATCSIFFAFIGGMITGLHMMDIGAIDYSIMLTAFVWPSVLLVLPALFLGVSLFFAVGLFSRTPMVVYITAGFCFIGYQTLLMLTGSPIMAQPILLSETLNEAFRLIDPVGASAFFEQVKHWTVEQRNSQHIMLDATLIANRTFVLVAGLAILGITYFRFSLTLPNKRLKPSSKSNVLVSHTTYENRQVHFGTSDKLKSLLSLCKQEYLLTIKTKSFALVCAFLAVVVGSEVVAGLSYLETMGVTPLPTTSVVVNRYMHDVIPNFGSLFIAFFVAQIMWRDQEYNVSGLIETTPATNSQFFIAKWLTLLAIPVTFIALSITVASALQILFGGAPDLILNLSIFYYAGAPLVCLASLFLLIHSLVKSKVLGMILSFVIAILAQSNLGYYIGIEHGMLRFSHTPILIHSQMLGFDASSQAFNDYMMLWSSLSLLFILLGFSLYRRGLDISLLQRIKVALANNRRGVSGFALAGALSVVASIGSASYLYYQINIVGQYKSQSAMLQWRADYERKYIKYQGLAQPTVTDVKNELAFFPDERRLALSSTYKLTNRTKKPINQVLISTNQLLEYSNVDLSNATLESFDSHFKQYLWQLNSPLLPGQSLTLKFNAKYQQNGHNNILQDNFLSSNFSYFREVRYLPFFGFVKHYLLKSDHLRKEYGLAPLPDSLTLEQDIAHHQGDFSDDYKWVTADIIVSTVKGQTAIAPGELVKQWSEGNRDYFQYKNANPMRHALAYFSFDLKKSAAKVDGIELEVYHQKEVSELAQEHLSAMRDTVHYANKHFSPYNAKQLRLIQMPNILGYSGYALPQIMLLDERLGFGVKRDNLDSSFDHLYRRTLHETAHQWWGHTLDSALTEGSSVLVESLAKLTEVLVLEQKYSKEYVLTLVQYEHDRYFNGRGTSRVQEKPLYRADEKHLLYSKGAVTMHALVNKFGANTMAETVSGLLADHHYPKAPATTLDFISQLKKRVDSNDYPFIDSWLKQVTLDDWQITKQSIVETSDGSYLANICYRNQAIKFNEQGEKLSAIPMDSVQLVFFSQHPQHLFNKPNNSHTLASVSVLGKQQEQCVEHQLAARPTHIALDPYYLTLDRNREDNLVIVN